MSEQILDDSKLSNGAKDAIDAVYDLFKSHKDYGATEFTLVYNGVPVKKDNKLVYTKNENGIKFYIKEAIKNASQKTKKNVYLRPNEVYTLFAKRMTSTKLCGVQTGISLPISKEFFEIKSDADLKYMFIESILYKTIRKLASEDYVGKRVINPINTEETLEPALTNALVRAFKEESIINYCNVVYAPKIIKKIYKAKPFYGVLKSYLPVVIECRYMYNPLTDNPAFNIRDYAIYKKAIERGRTFSIVDDKVSCTMLAHSEVCECLNINGFMRFTPQFLYKLLLSFSDTQNPELPSKSLDLLVAPQNTESLNGLKRVYTKQQYILAYQKLNSNQGAPQENTVNEESTDSTDGNATESQLALLKTYTAVNSLMYHLNNEYSKMLRYGLPATFEIGSSRAAFKKMYNMLSTASLLREVPVKNEGM